MHFTYSLGHVHYVPTYVKVPMVGTFFYIRTYLYYKHIIFYMLFEVRMYILIKQVGLYVYV